MVSKGKPEFSHSLWGYDPGQVDEYITSITKKYHESLTALIANLDEVTKDCSNLSVELLKFTKILDACTGTMQHLLFLSESILHLAGRENPDKTELSKATLHVQEHLASLKKELNSGQEYTGPLNSAKAIAGPPGIEGTDTIQKLQDVYRSVLNLRQNLISCLDMANTYVDRLVRYERVLSENQESYEIIKKAVRKAVFDNLAEELHAPWEETAAELEELVIQPGEPDIPGEPDAKIVNTAVQPFPDRHDRAENGQVEHSPGTALVVDDSPTIRAIVRAVLEREGYEVLEAVDGKEALEIVRDKPPCSLVILDLMLPYADGRQVTKAIRDNPAWSQVPIIVLSLSTAEQDVLSLFEAGANDYVVKPFSPLELGARIRRFKSPQSSRSRSVNGV